MKNNNYKYGHLAPLAEAQKEEIKARLKYLEMIQKNAAKSLAKAPEGFLRVSNSNGRTQYYHRTDPEDPRGKYIRSENKKLSKALAKKDYDQRLLRSAGQEIKALQYLLGNYPAAPVEDVYQALNPARKELVIPIEETDEMFLERWNSRFYMGNSFPIGDKDLITDRGEQVRSKSELIIANTLNKRGLSYHYECPVYLKDSNIVYPDFTILNLTQRTEFLWEHHGMMDDPEYAENSVHKLNSYIMNGYIPGQNLILTFETKLKPLSSSVVQILIDRYFN